MIEKNINTIEQEKNLKENDFLYFSNKLLKIKSSHKRFFSHQFSYKKINTPHSQPTTFFPREINTGLFGNNIEKITEENIQNAQNIKNKKIIEIKELIKEVKNTNLDNYLKNFLLNSLEESKYKLEILHYIIYVEAEKWWFELTNEERKAIVKKIDEFQNKIYGIPIFEHPEEKKLVLDKMTKLLFKYWYILNIDEKKQIKNFLNNFWYWYENWYEKEKKTIKNDSHSIYEKELNKEIKYYQLSPLLEKVCNFYWISLQIYFDWNKSLQSNTKNLWILDISDEYRNFSIDPNSKKIKIPKTAKLTKIKALKLLDHEIGVHVLRSENMKNTTMISWKWYQKHEEWLAKIFENICIWDKKDISIEIWKWHIRNFIAEHKDIDETYKLTFLFYRLLGEEKKKKGEDFQTIEHIEEEAYNRSLRSKMGLSIYEPWARRKDNFYFRWKKEIRETLQNLKSEKDYQQFLRNFYYTKISLKEMYLINWLKKLFNREEKIHLPLPIGKILYLKLLKEKIFFKDLIKEDKRLWIKKIKLDTKRKLINILQEIKELK